MRHAQSPTGHQSRPNRRFRRKIPAVAAVAALIAAAPGYAAVNPRPSRPVVRPAAARQSAVPLRPTAAAGTPQTIGGKT
jgi:hypothetical protein